MEKVKEGSTGYKPQKEKGKITTEQEWKEYKSSKEEALDFWKGLLPEVKYYQKIALLESEIKAAEAELQKVRRGYILDIRLSVLNSKNFKGIKDLSIMVRGNNADILGDNATGKTTQYDAFYWLLFDKDSSNRSNFGIKPFDANGEEVHFLETEVEGTLLIDDKAIKLKKVLAENWVKPRGQEQQEYKGNETTYWFDDVPVKRGEYQKKISELIDEETFKLITNPMHFNLYFKSGKLTDWQSRRALLFEMCGEVKDEDIIASDSKLSKLPDVLAGKTIEDRKTIIKSSISKLNAEIDSIGPKINENQRLIPENEIDYSATDKELSDLKDEIKAIEEELTGAANIANQHRDKQNKLFGMKSDLDKLKRRIDDAANEGHRKLQKEKSDLQTEKFTLEREISNLRSAISQDEIRIKNINSNLTRLREEWKEINSRVFNEPSDFSCPSCGQQLPDEQAEKIINDARINFEASKKVSLDTNITAGKANKADLEHYEKQIQECNIQIEEKQSRLNQISFRLQEIENELCTDQAAPDYESNPDYAELKDKIAELEDELGKPVEDSTAELMNRKRGVSEKIEACNRILNNRNVVQNAKDRIEELKEEEVKLARQKSQLEGQIFLIEKFMRTKVGVLTDSINNRFKHVRFRLFREQVNGGLEECCDTLVNTNGKWVPFSDGNAAGRINAGIDIINTLCEHYGVRAPIFIDNAESVTELIETKSQIIRLVKPDIRTPDDKEKYSRLIVEVKE